MSLRELIIEAIDNYEFEMWVAQENYENKLAAIRKDLEDILSDNPICRDKIKELLNVI